MANTEILISLDDERAKYISEVISNKSCRRILDYISENEGTVTDTANALKMPINTVDYNVKKLLKAGLIEKKSFWWSTRGKKMPTYVVSNKRIVISPKQTLSKSIKYLMALIGTGLAAIIIKTQTTTENIISSANDGASYIADESVRVMSENSAQMLSSDAATPTAKIALEKSGEIAASGSNLILSGSLGMDVWLWFLLGAWFAIFLFFLISFVAERRR